MISSRFPSTTAANLTIMTLLRAPVHQQTNSSYQTYAETYVAEINSDRSFLIEGVNLKQQKNQKITK